MSKKREISIEEMPQGCVLTHDNGQHFTVSSFEDATEIIESLQRMIAIQHHKYQEFKLIRCEKCGSLLINELYDFHTHKQETGHENE